MFWKSQRWDVVLNVSRVQPSHHPSLLPAPRSTPSVWPRRAVASRPCPHPAILNEAGLGTLPDYRGSLALAPVGLLGLPPPPRPELMASVNPEPSHGGNGSPSGPAAQLPRPLRPGARSPHCRDRKH